MKKRIIWLSETKVLIMLVILLIFLLFFRRQDLLSRVSENATVLSFMLAACALGVNFIMYKRRIAFDSLIKLHEIFHIELRKDRDKTVYVNITNDRELDEHIKKIDGDDQSEIKIERSILRVLNFYALMGMMIQNRYLSKDIAVKHFGGAICHKVEDWKAFIENLRKNENYKKMAEHFCYIYKEAKAKK